MEKYIVELNKNDTMYELIVMAICMNGKEHSEVLDFLEDMSFVFTGVDADSIHAILRGGYTQVNEGRHILEKSGWIWQ